MNRLPDFHHLTPSFIKTQAIIKRSRIANLYLFIKGTQQLDRDHQREGSRRSKKSCVRFNIVTKGIGRTNLISYSSTLKIRGYSLLLDKRMLYRFWKAFSSILLGLTSSILSVYNLVDDNQGRRMGGGGGCFRPSALGRPILDRGGGFTRGGFTTDFVMISAG